MFRNHLKKIYHLALKVLHWFTPFYYSVFPLDRWRSHRKIEIGCGSIKRKGWLTLDYRPGPDVIWDLTRPLPFKDNSFEEIYSSHVLEHFTYPQLIFLFKELHRILMPSGKMSICVPDASIYIRAYNEKNSKDLLRHKPAIASDRPMDFLNYIFYMGGEHKFMFDHDNLEFHLISVGFKNYRIREFDIELDGKDREYESLYAECSK
jgi:predicted SAM-dependent methyltransferase